jgi:hypothetical protein
MIDRHSARRAALEFINSNLCIPEELDITDQDPTDTARAWVFFYNTKRYLMTGEFSSRLAGNGPVLVNKESGEVLSFGADRPVEQILREYDESHGQ